MSGRDLQLPRGDRDEQPDPISGPPGETFTQRLERLARELEPGKMAAADRLAAKEAALRRRPRRDDGLVPITGARQREPGEDDGDDR